MNDSGYKHFDFHGSLTAPGGSPSEFTAAISFSKWDPTSMSVNLLWIGSEEERRRGSLILRDLERNHVWLQSLDPNQGAVELLGINNVNTSFAGTLPQSSSVRVAAVQIGITKDKYREAREYEVIVRLQPSGILSQSDIHTQHFTGEISISQNEFTVVKIQLCKSDFKVMMTYEFDETEEYGNKITNRIQRATLMGKIRVEAGENLFDIHEALQGDLSDVCTTLSLCYRQIVDYYEIEYIDCDDMAKSSQPLHRRRWNSTKAKTAGNELINTRALVGGGLQYLVANIKASPRTEDLHRAIQFIAASYTANLETAFFMSFSAMETVLSCCLEKSEEYTVGSSKWDKIRRGIKKAIEELVPNDNEVRTGLYDKLPELRRTTLTRRVKVACEKYDPKTDDLWLDMSFEEGMKRAAKIRNGLFHAADSNVEESIGMDLIRVRTFAERLLLKLLSWSDDDIWNWYDQDLKWINQGAR